MMKIKQKFNSFEIQKISPNYDFDFIVGETVFNTKRYGDGFSET